MCVCVCNLCVLIFWAARVGKRCGIVASIFLAARVVGILLVKSIAKAGSVYYAGYRSYHETYRSYHATYRSFTLWSIYW